MYCAIHSMPVNSSLYPVLCIFYMYCAIHPVPNKLFSVSRALCLLYRQCCPTWPIRCMFLCTSFLLSFMFCDMCSMLWKLFFLSHAFSAPRYVPQSFKLCSILCFLLPSLPYWTGNQYLIEFSLTAVTLKMLFSFTEFKYSTRVVCTYAVILLMLYQV